MRFVLLGAIVAATATPTPHGIGVQDFTLHNEIGSAITHVYVAPTDNPKWEEDVLGKDVLENGDSAEIRFTGYGDDVCKFDVKIKTLDDREWIVEKLDLCEMNDLKFSIEDGKIVYTKF